MTGQTHISTPTLRRFRAKNLLSFGPEGIDLEMSNLNVLIGPNASGKTNLFEVIRLLQASPSDLSEPVRTGGGISDWIWRGQPKSSATVEAVVENPHGNQALRHVIEFRESGRRFTLVDERIENEHPYEDGTDVYFFYRYLGGRPILASSRCQLIITTHSDILVDALSERPESVVVCEKHDGQTSLRRLDRSDLTRWLKRYGLGQLWTKGKLGGVRW